MTDLITKTQAEIDALWSASRGLDAVLEKHEARLQALERQEPLNKLVAGQITPNQARVERCLREEIDRIRAGKDAAEARAISLDTENEGLRNALKNQIEQTRRLREQTRRLREQTESGDEVVMRLQGKLADAERALRICERANEDQNRARERAEEQARMHMLEARSATYPYAVTALQVELQAAKEDLERLKQRIHEDREKLARHAEERQAVAAAARQQERHRIWNEVARRFEAGGGKAVKHLLACPELCDESPECVHVLRKEIGE